MNRLIKLMIVEDHAIFREGLKRVLEQMSGVALIGEFDNGASFLEAIEKERPDIVLLDIKMPIMDGIETAEKVSKKYPSLKILVLTMFGEEEYLFSMIQKGISGFVLKTARINEIEDAIRRIADGEHYFSPEVNGLLAKKVKQYSSFEIPVFTGREFEILKLTCRGLSTGEVSDQLHISKRTVEGYKAKLLQKTDQPNILNLVLYALRNKLVTIEELTGSS